MGHRKFIRFARSVGSKALARGILELLWDGCYEAGDDYLGTAEDIDQRVGWTGAPGDVASALVACGLPEGHGFIEPIKSDTGGAVTYRVHDLWHHAPEYVTNRRAKENERRTEKVCKRCRGNYFSADARSEYCSPACRTGGWRDRRRVTDGDGEVRHRDGRGTDRDTPPAPAPAPAQRTNPPSEDSGATLFSVTPPAVLLTFPTIGRGASTWDLTEAQCAEWQRAYPGLDVLGECRKALAWVDANQPKTAKGMKAFLVNWFNRAVKSGANRRPVQPMVAAAQPSVRQAYSPAVLAKMRERGLAS